MTKKHFESLARGMRDVKPEKPLALEQDTRHSIVWNQWVACLREIANVCQQENPRFDRDKFFRACGWNP